MNQFCFVLPEQWVAAVDKAAEKKGWTRAQWVRQAIRDALPKSVKLPSVRKPGERKNGRSEAD